MSRLITSVPLWKIAGFAILLSLGTAPFLPRLADAQARPGTDALESRVASLEKAVLKDPGHPDATVMARLSAIEKRLDQLQALRVDEEQDQKQIDRKQADNLKAAVGKTERWRDSVDRRLAGLERLKLDKATNETNTQLRDLRRDVDGLKSSIRDLQDKLRDIDRRL